MKANENKNSHYEVSCYCEIGGALEDIVAVDTLEQAKGKMQEMMIKYPYVEISQVFFTEDEDGIVISWDEKKLIESYNANDSYMTFMVECEVANSGVGARLESDGWSMTTNGHVENGVWFCIYTKSI